MAIDRMPNAWQKAITRYERWRTRGRLKPEFENMANLMLEELRRISSPDELVKKYYLGNYWALRIARRTYPDREDLWDMGITADVAYAKRYQELTGEDLSEGPDADEDEDI
jgi:hypothetical protein